DGVDGRLRHAAGPQPGAGGGPLAQRAAPAARGVWHERHEGGVERRTATQHAGRLVGRGLRWPNGWGIPPAPAGQDADAADAEQLYRLLEAEVVPLFYDRDAANVPRRWVETMKHALRAAGARFTAQRMVREYLTEYYPPATPGDPPADDPPTA